MSTQDNVTLHSDGTSKFGEHYGSYQISTEHGSYSLGLCEMLTGSAEITLHTFKQIISNLSLVSGKKCGDAIITKIKNTMSEPPYLYLKTIELMCYHRWYKAGASYLKLNKTNYPA